METFEWKGPMDFDVQVKLGVHRNFAETGRRSSPETVADRIDSNVESVLEAYRCLRELRVLVLEGDGSSIHMASPFAGVATSSTRQDAADLHSHWPRR